MPQSIYLSFLVNTKRIRLLSLAIAFIAVGWFLLCDDADEQAPVNAELLNSIKARAANPDNKLMVDSSVQLLRTGDLVVRTGNDITSYMLCQMNQKDKTYSHCGLVVIENGQPYVYHSIGGEANPDARLRRDPARIWFSPKDNLGFGIARLDVPDSLHDELAGTVARYHRERRMFDMDFDLATDDRLYCAEFVQKAMRDATGDSNYFSPTRIMGYTFLGIDDLFLSRHAAMICQIRFK